MHDTAFEIGKFFFELYVTRRQPRILDVGAVNINGSLRDCAPSDSKYVGVDIAAGPGVDIVLKDPNVLPLKSGTFDAVVASSCFEHAQMFWLTFLEIVRVTKPGGYIYISTPSNGAYHSYPYDNWRFYPDAGLALVAWAAHQKKPVSLVESFIAGRKGDQWNDSVLVFRKGPLSRRSLPEEILSDVVPACANVRTFRSKDVTNLIELSEDQRLLSQARNERQRLDELLGETRNNLASVSSEFAKRITLVATELASSRVEADGLRAGMQEYEATAIKLTADLQGLQEAAHDRDRLAAALAEEKAASANLTAELQGLQEAALERDGLAAALAEEKAAAALASERTATIVDEFRNELEALRSALAERTAAATKLKIDLDTAGELASARADKIAEASSKLAAAQSLIREHEQRISQLDRDIKTTRLYLHDSQTEVQRLAGELSMAQMEAEQVGALEQQVSALQRQITDLVAEMQSSTAQSNAREEELKRAVENVERLEAGLATQMAAYNAAIEERDRKAEAQIRATRDQLVDAEASLARARLKKKIGGFSVANRIAVRRILKSGLFNSEWYLGQYPEVAKSGYEPVEHYLNVGYLRGYRPNPFFDTRWYLERYEDVRHSGANPLVHWLEAGCREGRNPGPEFETDFYLLANPDVRASGMNPLRHYLLHGQGEGRLALKP